MKKVLLLFVIVSTCSLLFAQPTTGLMAYWRMNGNFNDSTANALHGTPFGNPPDTTNNLSVAAKAKRFNNPTGTGVQYVTTPINAAINFSGTQNFTVSFAFHITTPWVHNGGFIDNNLNYGGYGVWVWPEGPPGNYSVHFNYKNASVGTTSIPIGTWKYICAVRNNGSLQLYVDGVLNNSVAEGTMAPSYTFAPRIGSMFFNGFSPPQYNPLHGSLDEMRIYNRALSQAEITSLYNAWLFPLPVKLSSFTAVINNNNISLNWQTQAEQNSSHFSIQRSTDGINFTEIGQVPAKGNSSTVCNYSYTDNLNNAVAASKTLFYRLKPVDLDGKFSLSNIVSIHLSKTKMNLFLSPNPARDILQVQTSAIEKANAVIQILDAAGRRILEKQVVLNPGTNSIQVNISTLQKGTYTLRLFAGKENYTELFLKD